MQRRARAKVDRLTHRSRIVPSRVFRVEPEPGRPFHVEVRIASTRRRMREEMLRLEDHIEARNCMGLLRSYSRRIGEREPVIRPRGLVARMYLNVRDMRRMPSELVSHECAHAGMAWARLQRANLARMAGEEVMAHATGRLVAQLNRIGYAHGVWA